MEALIAAMKQFEAIKHVVDITYAKFPHINDLQLLVPEWYENAVKVGHPYIAIILPHDIHAQIMVENAINEFPVQIAYFYTMKTALDWIKQF